MHEFEFIKNKTVGIVYDIGIGFLSVIAVLVVVLQFSPNLTESQSMLLNYFDNSIYGIFLIDGIIKCFLAKDWKKFILKNKIDYVALFPFQFFMTGALGSIFKLARVVTYFFRIIDNMKVFLFTTGFFQIIVSTGIITFMGSLAIYVFEREGESISSYGDALWLSLVTLTTVGYGDMSPKTSAGKVIAIFLMLTGIGFLSMLTSTISSYIISLKEIREIHTVKKDEREYVDITDLDEKDREAILSYYKYLKSRKE